MIYEHLGDARVGMYILNHGVPELLDAHLRRTPHPKALLQNMLAEFVMWHSSLLKWLLAREKDPNMPVAHQLSDPKLCFFVIEGCGKTMGNPRNAGYWQLG